MRMERRGNVVSRSIFDWGDDGFVLPAGLVVMAIVLQKEHVIEYLRPCRWLLGLYIEYSQAGKNN